MLRKALSQVKPKPITSRYSKYTKNKLNAHLLLCTPLALKVLNIVIRVCTNNKYCYMRQDTIARELGCSRVTVNRLMKLLHRLGLITSQNRGVKQTCLVLLNPCFLNLSIRNMFSNIFPALRYFPLIALFSMSLMGAQKEHKIKHVIQDVNINIYLKKDIKLRSYARATLGGLKTAKCLFGEELYNKFVKTDPDTPITIPKEHTVTDNTFFTQPKYRLVNDSEEESPKREVHSSDPMHNPSTFGDSIPSNKGELVRMEKEMLDRKTIAELKQELEHYRENVIRRKGCTVEELQFYTEVRSFIEEVEASKILDSPEASRKRFMMQKYMHK